MQQVTYIITFLIGDDVSKDQIDDICANAYVQIDDAEIADPEDTDSTLRFSTDIISSDIEIVAGR